MLFVLAFYRLETFDQRHNFLRYGSRGGKQIQRGTGNGQSSGGQAKGRGIQKAHRRGGPGNMRVGKPGRGHKSDQKKDKKPKTKEELDAEMDAYFLQDEKTAKKKLEEDMDDYWKAAPAKEEGQEETAAL